MKFINTATRDVAVNNQKKWKAGEERSVKDLRHQEFLMRHPYIKPKGVFQAIDRKTQEKVSEEKKEDTKKGSHKAKRIKAST